MLLLSFVHFVLIISCLYLHFRSWQIHKVTLSICIDACMYAERKLTAGKSTYFWGINWGKIISPIDHFCLIYFPCFHKKGAHRYFWVFKKTFSNIKITLYSEMMSKILIFICVIDLLNNLNSVGYRYVLALIILQ